MALKESKLPLYEIANSFHLNGKIQEIVAFGSGHIHDTYQVKTDSDDCYILQRMNDTVFKNIHGMMNNLNIILTHLNHSGIDFPFKLFKTHDQKSYLCDKSNNYWRMYYFIPGMTYDRVASPQIAFSGGKAFGSFIRCLEGLSPDKLIEIIPFFHDLQARLDQFNMALENGNKDRISEVNDEINKVKFLSDDMLTIYRLGKEGQLPKRILHNDTKINNVLFDSNNNAVCVIDLDTVMPGYIHYDFGDMLRTGASSANEDEMDLSMVDVNFDLAEQYIKGFLSETKSILTKTELEILALSPVMMTYIMGVRFLTDYMKGDVYYKIKYPQHNLVRARNQLHLVDCYLKKQSDIKDIINSSI